ncbi:MAG: transporter related [Cyanobacteria bacterium RYN_339]|nr:transporter related [Cyanobacteria bacterium RYN_339]
MDAAIRIRGLAKCYPLYQRPQDRLIELITRKSRHQEFWALHEVDLELPRGATVGVIGANGSGKSTLLQIVAGVLSPTRGTVEVNGRVAALLELGAGFTPDFSGRENVFMGGAVMGLSREEMAARFDAIVAFAEIGEFIDQPVKTYSSGMYVRLAFALAIHVDPEVLLVDEALAVGDAVFQHRCMRKIRELQERGVTILFVSHDTAAVKSLCTQAVLMEHGRVVEAGDPDAVVNRYHARVAASIAPAEYVEDGPAVDDPHFGETAGFFRHGTGEAKFTDVTLLDGSQRVAVAVETGKPVTVRARLRCEVELEGFAVGFFVKDRQGIEVFGSNTVEEGQPIGLCRAGERVTLDFSFPASLRPGHYSVTVAAAYNRHDMVYLDWVDNALVFQVLPAPGGRAVHGLVDLPLHVSVTTEAPSWT